MIVPPREDLDLELRALLPGASREPSNVALVV